MSPAPKRAAPSAASAPARKKARTEGSEFRTVRAAAVLALPPVFAGGYAAGAAEMLDSLLMRYQPALRGVVLAHANLRFLEGAGRVIADCPFAAVRVGFDATVWAPEIGMKLSGNVSVSSPDHVSLLAHRTFNVSVPRHHIPADQWEFEHAEDEPTPEPAADGEGEGAGAGAEGQERERGRWIHKVTADPLGGRKGRLEFTVVGMTIANNMLSLVGSLQPDPFSPAHVPQPAALSVAPRAEPEDEKDDEDKDGDVQVQLEEADEASGSEEEEDEEEQDEALAAAQRAETARREMKRQRKEERARENGAEDARKKGAKRKKA